MQEKASHHKQKPGLEEAIHSAIGNGAAWENDPHALQLRSVDPAKALERFLETEAELTPVNGGLQPEANEQVEEPANNSALIESGSPPDPELTEVTGEIFSEAAFEEKTSQPEEPPVTKLIKTKKEKSGDKAGKLIRRVARKAKKEEEEIARDLDEKYASLRESNLSPFTQWVKGLRGSEYVHPYGDDFAIHQSLGEGGEGVSETFADLLASQGYKEQAIAMYTKLIEKFPEKSRFFAAKIEALQ